MKMLNQNKQLQSGRGASIYSKPFLSIYDYYVLKISNTFIWKCPSTLILDFYNEHISSQHLDVGVGTGYFLDKCKFLKNNPNIHLIDLNQNTLDVTARRISRYHPIVHQADILKSLELDLPKFDSIGLSYLLHCLPGDLSTKEVVFKNLKPLLNKNGILFGTTILGVNKNHNYLNKKILNLYNSKCIFSNKNDNIIQLEEILRKNFKSYTIKENGCVAFFTGKN